MEKLTINGDLYHIPSRWNELTPAQFLRVAELSLTNINSAEFKLKLFLTITGLRVLPKPRILVENEPCFYLAHGKTREYLVSVDELAGICNLLGFMLREVEQKGGGSIMLLDSRLFRQLIPEIKVQGETWIGPVDAITNILFTEYIHAETAFNNYNKTGDHVHIDSLIAILYRPDAGLLVPGPDKRAPFNDAAIVQRSRMLGGVDPVLKNAILMWYEGCRSYIAEKFPEVFSYSSPNAKKQDVFESFLYLVNALTNNDVTKTEQVRQSYLYEVMVALNAIALQNIEMEKSLKKK